MLFGDNEVMDGVAHKKSPSLLADFVHEWLYDVVGVTTVSTVDTVVTPLSWQS